MTSPNQPAPDGARSYEQVAGLRTVKVPGNIDQGLYDQAETMRGSFLGNILSGFGSIGQAIGNALNDLVNAFFGNYEGENEALHDFQDGQLALRNTVALLQDVSGYAVAYIPVNFYRNANYDFILPFRAVLVPGKNAEIKGDGRIRLAKGTWQIFAQVTADQHNNLMGLMRIEVLYPNGSIYSYKEIQKNIDANKWNTFQGYHTVILPANDYHVRVRFRYNAGPLEFANLYFRGGTHLSHLAVNRLNLNTEDAFVDEDVPDE